MPKDVGLANMTRSKALGIAGAAAGAAAVAAGAAGVAATALLVGAANAAGVFSGAEAVLSCALKREAVFGQGKACRSLGQKSQQTAPEALVAPQF